MFWIQNFRYTFFTQIRKNWVGFMIYCGFNVRVVKNAVQVQENIVQNNIAIGKVQPP